MKKTSRLAPGSTAIPLRNSLLSLGVAIALVGCAGIPHELKSDEALMQEALTGTDNRQAGVEAAVLTESVRAEPQTVKPTTRIKVGTQQFVRPKKLGRSASAVEDGEFMFNFTSQPIDAVINSIMGDLLHESYSIAQGVKGSVSFSTSKPVNKKQALSILETLLSWTDNAMIHQGGRYVVLPAAQAVAGKLVPEMPVSQPSNGLSARLYPLQYISATEMQKLLKPFVRENAFLLVDPSRNVVSLAGTPDELANYQDTIDTFDVDWLKGMSIGVYALQHASVEELMPQLQKIFGPDSGMPLSSMVKFLPNERTNSIVAFSSQPAYLQEVGDWIKAIDEGGDNVPQLYVYDVRNIKATDLARYLRQIYGTAAVSDEGPAKVAPGLRTTNLSTLNGTTSGIGNAAGTALGSSTGEMMGANQGESDDLEPSMEEEGGDESSSDATANGQDGRSLEESVRITAQKSTNQLLVRTRPAQWKEIESAIKRLDNLPMQVQIETRILEVKLTGDLDLGVQWYLGRLAGNSGNPAVANAPGGQGALGAGGAGLGAADSLFYSFVSNNLQVALRALETNGKTQVLSAPSLVVMNNQKAQIQVGDNIPVNQTTINTTNADTTLSSVEYVQTGVILNVVPRINPGGLVYMDIQQQVSDADVTGVTAAQPNPRISTRSVSTQVAVQNGQTVLLGGLIQQNNAESTSSVPGLSRIPGLKWLFGSTSKSRGRTELIVLITPRVVVNADQARQVTAAYRQQMQLLKYAQCGNSKPDCSERATP